MVTLGRDGEVFDLSLGDEQNRFTPEFVAAVDTALDTVEAAAEPRALVTTASGKIYSLGLDLDWVTKPPTAFFWGTGALPFPPVNWSRIPTSGPAASPGPPEAQGEQPDQGGAAAPVLAVLAVQPSCVPGRLRGGGVLLGPGGPAAAAARPVHRAAIRREARTVTENPATQHAERLAGEP